MRKTINRARVCVCVSGLRVILYVCVHVYISTTLRTVYRDNCLMFCTLHTVVDKYII